MPTGLEPTGTTNSPLDSGSPNESDVKETSPQTPAVEQQEQEPTQQVEPTDVDSLPEWVQKTIKELRQENASRRVENKSLSTQVEQLTGMFQQIATQLSPPSGESNSPEQTPAIPESPDQLQNVVSSMVKTLDNLSRENTVLRVSQETGIPTEIVQKMSGNTYDEISTAANSLVAYVSEHQGATPTPPAPSKPKAPSGDKAVGKTDAQRYDQYFGGGPSAAGIFGKEGGGVVIHDLE